MNQSISANRGNLAVPEIVARAPHITAKTVVRSFGDEINRMLTQYADKNLPLTVKGFTFSADEKYTDPAATMLYTKYMSDYDNAFSNVLNAYDLETKLAQKLWS